jgi:hypothetical protein
VNGGWPGAGAFANTEKELQRERAAALRRIASQLESLVERLAARRAALGNVSGPERGRALAEYAALREEARRWRWYLEVQRESVGFMRHDILNDMYPIPDAVDA